MSNEELVALIQAGEREKLAELWEQVERFVAVKAHRRHLLSDGLGGVEVEDLYQSGYLALVAAVDTYDPTAGRSFISWLALALKTAFAEAGSYRSSKQARDPLHRAGSVDMPVSEDNDTAIVDLIADPDAAQGFQDAEDRVYREQLRGALEKALDELPARQGDTLRRRFYQSQSLREIAAAEGVYPEAVRQWQEKGLRALRRRRELQQFVETRTPYYGHWGARTGERTTEMIVLKRERLTEPRDERPSLDRELLEAQAAGVSRDYIDSIADPFVRIAFRMRFSLCFSWKEVAAVIGCGRTWTDVRDACLRYFKAHPEPSQKEGDGYGGEPRQNAAEAIEGTGEDKDTAQKERPSGGP